MSILCVFGLWRGRYRFISPPQPWRLCIESGNSGAVCPVDIEIVPHCCKPIFLMIINFGLFYALSFSRIYHRLASYCRCHAHSKRCLNFLNNWKSVPMNLCLKLAQLHLMGIRETKKRTMIYSNGAGVVEVSGDHSLCIIITKLHDFYRASASWTTRMYIYWTEPNHHIPPAKQTALYRTGGIYSSRSIVSRTSRTELGWRMHDTVRFKRIAHSDEMRRNGCFH
jgi:hypothetical protein